MKKTTPQPAGVVGRNDPCPCGSGKKFKKCCGDPAAFLSGRTDHYGVPLLEKWDALDQEARRAHKVTVAGLICVSADAKVGVMFHPTLDDIEKADLMEAMRSGPPKQE